MTFRTELCDLLGIEYPIVQSGMGNVAGPDLVAAVSEAGGLGILAGLRVLPDDLRARLREVRTLTKRPFGLNLWLHRDVLAPVDPASVSETAVRAVQSTLNTFRERLGLAPTFARPEGLPDLFEAAFEVMLEERPAVFSTGIGTPTLEMVRRCHERGIKVIAMVATVQDAREMAAVGVDAIVAQGGEAGGHRSTGVKLASPEAASVGTMALVPQIVDAVGVPVVAAGAIADGRGLLAALALGASGILLGTRFVATREATVPEFQSFSAFVHVLTLLRGLTIDVVPRYTTVKSVDHTIDVRTFSLPLQVRYQFNPWLTGVASYTLYYQRSNSTSAVGTLANDVDQNRLFVGLQFGYPIKFD